MKNKELEKAQFSNQDDIFIKHIQNHLKEDEVVICKICGKTVDEIIKENKMEEIRC